MKEERPKPKIGPYQERIAQIIEEDKDYPKKQRHTAKRIYDRIIKVTLGVPLGLVRDCLQRGWRVRDPGS